MAGEIVILHSPTTRGRSQISFENTHLHPEDALCNINWSPNETTLTHKFGIKQVEKHQITITKILQSRVLTLHQASTQNISKKNRRDRKDQKIRQNRKCK